MGLKIRLTKRDLLEWLHAMPDDNRVLITTRFTSTGDMLSVQVNELAEWLWQEEEEPSEHE